MGCMFKSFGIIIILVLLLPVILLLSFFGRTRYTSVHRGNRQEEHAGETENRQNTHDDTSSVTPDTPIDQSTVEYIEFEEVKEESKENR